MLTSSAMHITWSDLCKAHHRRTSWLSAKVQRNSPAPAAMHSVTLTYMLTPSPLFKPPQSLLNSPCLLAAHRWTS